MPAAFWGPEELDHQAWLEFVARLDASNQIEILIDALAGSSRVLDVGGGTGLVTQKIAEHHGRVTVVEPSTAQSARIQTPPGAVIEIRPGRAEAIPARDGEFDAVLATWVLQYTDAPFVAVAELARVCADEPGARILIVQAAPWNDVVQVYNAEAQAAGLAPAHHGFLLAGAADVLQTSGFEHVSLSVVQTQVRVPERSADQIASVLQRLHFAGHPRAPEMLQRTRPLLGGLLARSPGVLNYDGVLLVARR
jgi:ubiquinone/menaquinone biosynthesis C-methylase UbiE